MGFLSSLTSVLNPFGGGGGGGGGVSSGGIGSSTGNASNAGNTSTTTTTNTDKRQVINSGGVGAVADKGNITVNSTSSDPQNFAAMAAVLDHLAIGTMSMLASSADASQAVVSAATTPAAKNSTIGELYANNKPAFLAGGLIVAYIVISKA